MSLINFESLGIDATVPDSFRYIHDGAVNYKEYVHFLEREYKVNTKKMKPFVGGRCITFKEFNGSRTCRTSVELSLSESSRTFITGHEQTHALIDIQNILGIQTMPLLEKVLHASGYIGNPLTSLDEEVRANVGGIYALKLKYPYQFLDTLKRDLLLFEIDLELQIKNLDVYGTYQDGWTPQLPAYNFSFSRWVLSKFQNLKRRTPSEGIVGVQQK